MIQASQICWRFTMVVNVRYQHSINIVYVETLRLVQIEKEL